MSRADQRNAGYYPPKRFPPFERYLTSGHWQRVAGDRRRRNLSPQRHLSGRGGLLLSAPLRRVFEREVDHDANDPTAIKAGMEIPESLSV